MSVPKLFSNQDDMLARSTVETWVIKAEPGEQVRLFFFLFREIGTKICEIRFRTQDCCPKCSGKVFEAEKMVTAAVSSNFQYFLWQSELF